MRVASLLLAGSFVPIAIGGCADQAASRPFNVVVRGPAESCVVEVMGRRVTTDELLAIARPEATRGRSAHIDSDMAKTPWRCVGGAIYVLQMAGFKYVGFIADPLGKTNCGRPAVDAPTAKPPA
jgi:hypothetical protein